MLIVLSYFFVIIHLIRYIVLIEYFVRSMLSVGYYPYKKSYVFTLICVNVILEYRILNVLSWLIVKLTFFFFVHNNYLHILPLIHFTRTG